MQVRFPVDKRRQRVIHQLGHEKSSALHSFLCKDGHERQVGGVRMFIVAGVRLRRCATLQKNQNDIGALNNRFIIKRLVLISNYLISSFINN